MSDLRAALAKIERPVTMRWYREVVDEGQGDLLTGYLLSPAEIVALAATPEPTLDDSKLLRDARDHIEGLNGLLAAYRVGTGRTPEKALRLLDRTEDVPARLHERTEP